MFSYDHIVPNILMILFLVCELRVIYLQIVYVYTQFSAKITYINKIYIFHDINAIYHR